MSTVAQKIPSGTLFDDNGPKRHKYFHVERWVFMAIILVVEFTTFQPIFNWTSKYHERLASPGVARIEKPWAIFEYFGSLGSDDTDDQLHNITENLLLLATGLSAFVLISRALRSTFGPLAQQLFRFIVGLAVIVFLHGSSMIFVVVLVVLNYVVMKLTHRCIHGRILFPVMWAAQVGLLIAIDRYKTESLFHRLSATLHPASVLTGRGGSGSQWDLGDWLQQRNGFVRWTILFNLSTLRMLSFNYDFYEATYFGPKSRELSADKHKRSCVDCALEEAPCYKLRSDYAHPKDKYTLFNYLTYMFYTPLYLAGPMSSFNAFQSHAEKPQQWMTWGELRKYAMGVLRLYLCIEVFVHFVHFNAIRAEMESSKSVLHPERTMGIMVSLGMVSLAFLWLKFSFIWKFFRFFSLVDGIDVPEDMKRCFSDVITISDFWQGWHSSFNVWLVRYMYIPLGGGKTKLFSVWIIFGFIALWHDVEFRLMFWAAVMCTTLLLEGLGIAFFSNRRFFGKFHDSHYWRLYRTFAAFGSCFALFSANYIGFGGAGGGGDGESGGEMPVGPWYLVAVMPTIWLLCAFCGVIIRENEKYRHDWLKAKYFPAEDKAGKRD